MFPIAPLINGITLGNTKHKGAAEFFTPLTKPDFTDFRLGLCRQRVVIAFPEFVLGIAPVFQSQNLSSGVAHAIAVPNCESW